MEEARGAVGAVAVTDPDTVERHVFRELLEPVADEIKHVSAAGADDHRQCYQAIKQRGARAPIPPGWAAVVKGQAPCAARDENLPRIGENGRQEWKPESGLPRRSLSGADPRRVTTSCGDRLLARRDAVRKRLR